MVYTQCQQCRGDLWIEDDTSAHPEDLVCSKCGHRQAGEAGRKPPGNQDRKSRITVMLSRAEGADEARPDHEFEDFGDIVGMLRGMGRVRRQHALDVFANSGQFHERRGA